MCVFVRDAVVRASAKGHIAVGQVGESVVVVGLGDGAEVE
jgi:hypothetical protein